jgi:glutamyl-Q tRNA(Asp) synthetase
VSYITRFAPSPTGPLHLGHAFSALTAWERAKARGGTFLLRIEDLDAPRCRPEWEVGIYEDLRWLGLSWPEPVMRQSARGEAYASALNRLISLGLCYPCRCTRGDIRAALSAPQESAGRAAEALIYPGTCRGRGMSEAGPGDAIRIDLARALERLAPPPFTETGPAYAGQHFIEPDHILKNLGDVILARRGIGAAYHLAVVVDDAAQGVTEAVRGADLFGATFLHVLLQAALELPTPSYHHHRLIRDGQGKRLAKRDDARALAKFRAEDVGPEEIRRMVGPG